MFKEYQFTIRAQNENVYRGVVPQEDLSSNWLKDFSAEFKGEPGFRSSCVKITVFMPRKKFQMDQSLDYDLAPGTVAFVNAQPEGVILKKGEVAVEVQVDY